MAVNDSGDILNPNYFSPDIFIIYQNGTQADPFEPNGQSTYGDIVLEAIHILLKILLSGILTDLGQKSSSNLFAQPPLLVQFLQEHNTVSQRRFAACCKFD